jgi:hypothetical protein
MTHVLRQTTSLVTCMGLLLAPTLFVRLAGGRGFDARAGGVATSVRVGAVVGRDRNNVADATDDAVVVSAAALEAGGVFGDEAASDRCVRLPALFDRDVETPGAARIAYKRNRTTEALMARIHTAACRFGVDPAIGEGVAWTESRFDEAARSPDGLSYGAFQLTASTAAQMRSRLVAARSGLPLHDEVTLGIGYLRYLSRVFARPTVLDDTGLRATPIADPVERWRFAIAAYNAGEGRVADAQRRAAALGRNPTRFEDVRPLLPPITRRYVDKVIAFGAGQSALDA